MLRSRPDTCESWAATDLPQLPADRHSCRRTSLSSRQVSSRWIPFWASAAPELRTSTVKRIFSLIPIDSVCLPHVVREKILEWRPRRALLSSRSPASPSASSAHRRRSHGASRRSSSGFDTSGRRFRTKPGQLPGESASGRRFVKKFIFRLWSHLGEDDLRSVVLVHHQQTRRLPSVLRAQSLDLNIVRDAKLILQFHRP